MSAKNHEYFVQLIDKRTGSAIDDDTGIYNVLTAGSPTEVTIYSNQQGTSASNPGTMTNGVINFWTAKTTTSVDLTVLTASGHAVFIEGLTPSQHRIEIEVERRNNQTLILPLVFGTGSAAVVDSGFDLLAGMIVKDVHLHITTVSSANQVYVGVSGTTDGFLLLGEATSTGFKFYDKAIVTTLSDLAGTYGNCFVTGTQKRGSLLCDFNKGIITAVSATVNGFFVKKAYNVTAATSIVYAGQVTNTLASGGAYIYIDYDFRPTAGN